jgi:hypothetical protein
MNDHSAKKILESSIRFRLKDLFIRDNPFISPYMIHQIAVCCPNLRSLDVSECTQLKDKHIYHLISGNNNIECKLTSTLAAPNLHQIGLSELPRMTDSFIEWIGSIPFHGQDSYTSNQSFDLPMLHTDLAICCPEDSSKMEISSPAQDNHNEFNSNFSCNLDVIALLGIITLL